MKVVILQKLSTENPFRPQAEYSLETIYDKFMLNFALKFLIVLFEIAKPNTWLMREKSLNRKISKKCLASLNPTLMWIILGMSYLDWPLSAFNSKQW